MRLSQDRKTIGASIAALLSAAVVATATAGGESPEPRPLGTPPSGWTTPDDKDIVPLMPGRASVSTLDGQILRDTSGAPVTVPLGDETRSVVVQEGDAQLARAMILQAQDACDRGIGYPIGGSSSGDGTMAEHIAESKRKMEQALAANDGNPYRDACEVVEELRAAQR